MAWQIIEETKKMEIPGCGRSLLCELCEICVSFLENLRYFLVAANGRATISVNSAVENQRKLRLKKSIVRFQASLAAASS